MKKLFLAIAAVAMVFATSCNKENTNAPEEPAVAGDNEFICVIDQNANPQNAPAVSDGMGTLAHIDGYNNVWWQEGDQIAYYGQEVSEQAAAYHTLTCSATSDNKAYFSDPDKHFGQGEHKAYYPASLVDANNNLTLPSTITLEANKNAAQLPMYGEGTGSHYLTFHNICAVMKITIPSFLNGATRFEISSDKAMNGAFTINNNTAVMSATSPTDAEKKITVQKSSGTFATNETVYVAVPAQTYNSLKIEFFDGAASLWKKTISNATVAVSKVYPITLSVMDHQYVDLGLSVKWATCNIGASDPWEFGNYYAWGETTSKYDYTNETYSFWCNDAAKNYLSKYNISDNKTVLDPEDDAAHVNWGGNWRMPTASEFQELIDNCTLVWMTNYQSSGNNGYLITSNKTGYTDKSIFLPATCRIIWGSAAMPWDADQVAFYWTSMRTSNDAWQAINLYFSVPNKQFEVQYQHRTRGHSVRPVCP